MLLSSQLTEFSLPISACRSQLVDFSLQVSDGWVDVLTSLSRPGKPEVLYARFTVPQVHCAPGTEGVGLHEMRFTLTSVPY